MAYGKPRSETRTWPVSSWNVQNATGSCSTPAARLPPSSADDTAAGDEDRKDSNARGITDAGVAMSGGERHMGVKRENILCGQWYSVRKLNFFTEIKVKKMVLPRHHIILPA